MTTLALTGRDWPNLYAGDHMPADEATGLHAMDVLARVAVPCDMHNPDDPEAVEPVGYVPRCPYCGVRWHSVMGNGSAGYRRLNNADVHEDGAITRVVVRPGQVWADYDSRSPQRRIRIVETSNGYAVVELVGERGRPARGHEAEQVAEPGRQTRVRLGRFRPTSTGYVLVEDVDPGPVDPSPEELLRLVDLHGDACASIVSAGEQSGYDDIREAEERAALLRARIAAGMLEAINGKGTDQQ